MSNATKSFDSLATSLSILHNYFDDSNKIIFKTVSQQNRYFHGSIKIFNLNSRERL